MAEADPLAAEKFRVWSQRKSVRDKALDLIGQLSSSRVDDADKFKELAISFCAVDKMLGDDGDSADKKNSMKSSWLKWTIDRKYKFDRVQLTSQDYKDFSGAVK